MSQYVSKTTQMIALSGKSIRMQAGVARPIPEGLVAVALTKGVTEVNKEKVAEPAPEPEVVDPEVVAQVVEAIKILMDEGDPQAFGKTSNEPLLTPLRKQAGFQVTDAQRDAAWAQVQAEV